MKADQKARGRYLGGSVPFGFRLGESGELVPHEGEQKAIREIMALRAQGQALRPIADAMREEGPPNQSRGRGGHPQKGGGTISRPSCGADVTLVCDVLSLWSIAREARLQAASKRMPQRPWVGVALLGRVNRPC